MTPLLATDALLDSYDEDRQAFAERLVKTTDKVFTMMTAGGSFVQFVRADVFPVVAPLAMQTSFMQAFVFHRRESSRRWVSIDGVTNTTIYQCIGTFSVMTAPVDPKAISRLEAPAVLTSGSVFAEFQEAITGRRFYGMLADMRSRRRTL